MFYLVGVGVAELGTLGVRPASALTVTSGGLAADRVIAVLPVLRELLPHRGLVRGTTVALGGVGATSLLLALLAEATRQDSWAAVVGLPGLGVAAAQAMGVALQRLVLVPDAGPDIWKVVATLLDGFDLVAVACGGVVSAAVASQLAARARRAGSVLLAMADWPSPAVTIMGRSGRWYGRGRLRCRQLTVRVTGRASAARPVEAQIWLPDDPALRAAITEPTVAAQRPDEQCDGEGAHTGPGEAPVRRLRVVP